MAHIAPPRPPPGQHQRPRHRRRRSWFPATTALRIILISAMLTGAAIVAAESHLLFTGRAGRTAVGVKNSPWEHGVAPPPIISAPPEPTHTRAPTRAPTRRQRPRTQPLMPTGVRGDWKLTFDDEFNGTSLDTTKWSTGWFGSGITPPVNSEEEDCYDPAQVSESGGTLSLTVVQKSEDCGSSDPVYTTGLVSTQGKYSFTYGFAEARVWLPSAAGDPGQIANWPAVWMDGENWPEDGEIDIAEGLDGTMCSHFHDAANPEGLGAGNVTGCRSGANYVNGWHTYAADWEPGIVTYYYDGVDIGSITSGITSAPMFIILDYAVGKSFQAPDTMKVDYVRVWQRP
jgi:hypothetical protein